MDWISVKDRLPEKYDCYFIYPRPDYDGTVEVFDAIFSPNSGEWKIDLSDGYSPYCVPVTVTHWMMIPEPPTTN